MSRRDDPSVRNNEKMDLISKQFLHRDAAAGNLLCHCREGEDPNQRDLVVLEASKDGMEAIPGSVCSKAGSGRRLEDEWLDNNEPLLSA